MDDIKNSFFQIAEEEKDSLPFFSHLMDFYSEEERNAPFPFSEDFEQEEASVFACLSEDVDRVMRYSNDLVSFTSVWHGRVLSILQDTVLARISKQFEDEKEYYVEISKNKLSRHQLERMAPGSLFDWSFGYKYSDSDRRFWKLELQQSPKPTPEAIMKMVANLTAGFEHYYDDKD